MKKQYLVLVGVIITTIIIISCGFFAYQYFVKSHASIINVKNSNVETVVWQAYTNDEGKFSLQYPLAWVLSGPGTLGISLAGREGSIEIRYKGTYGIESCPGSQELFELNGKQLNTCHGTRNDDSEFWIITLPRENDLQTVTILANANNPHLSKRDVILKMLSTFTFANLNQAPTSSLQNTTTNSGSSTPNSTSTPPVNLVKDCGTANYNINEKDPVMICLGQALADNCTPAKAITFGNVGYIEIKGGDYNHCSIAIADSNQPGKFLNCFMNNVVASLNPNTIFNEQVAQIFSKNPGLAMMQIIQLISYSSLDTKNPLRCTGSLK